MAVALLMLACQTKIENRENIENIMADSAVPAMCLEMAPPPPLTEMVKFTPPIIKDDAVEEGKPIAKSTTKKIIKDGNVSIEVTVIEIAKSRMDSVLKKFGAYYEQEEFQNNEQRTSYNLKIRVPSKNFEHFLSAAEKGNGEITYKSINTRDVTEEYTDTEIRTNSKKTFRTRYNELLSKAGKVTDILEIEENLRVLQEEIESNEGRLKFLDDQVLYSTLDVYLFVPKEFAEPEKKQETFGKMINNSLGSGWESVITFILWSIKQWPWMIVILVFIFGLKRYLKKRKK